MGRSRARWASLRSPESAEGASTGDPERPELQVERGMAETKVMQESFKVPVVNEAIVQHIKFRVVKEETVVQPIITLTDTGTLPLPAALLQRIKK